MNASARIHAMFNLDETAEAELDQRIAEVVAERDAMTLAWLVKKAREYRAAGETVQADTVFTIASKIARGAVRPDNLRTLPADFFEPGRTYAHDEYRFICEYLTSHPVSGHLSAWGWFGKNGAWRHMSFSRRQFQVREWTDVTEVAQGGEAA